MWKYSPNIAMISAFILSVLGNGSSVLSLSSYSKILLRNVTLPSFLLRVKNPGAVRALAPAKATNPAPIITRRRFMPLPLPPLAYTNATIVIASLRWQ